MKELREILKVLYEAHLEFAVIGGAAYVTQDVAFCYSRTQQNIKRLAAALEPYHPALRGAPANLPFKLDARTVAQGMNFTLSTDLGDPDFLGEVTGLGGYKDVKAATDIQIIDGIQIAVLSLVGLIKSKRAAGRPKDLYVLPGTQGLSSSSEKQVQSRLIAKDLQAAHAHPSSRRDISR